MTEQTVALQIDVGESKKDNDDEVLGYEVVLVHPDLEVSSTNFSDGQVVAILPGNIENSSVDKNCISINGTESDVAIVNCNENVNPVNSALYSSDFYVEQAIDTFHSSDGKIVYVAYDNEEKNPTSIQSAVVVNIGEDGKVIQTRGDLFNFEDAQNRVEVLSHFSVDGSTYCINEDGVIEKLPVSSVIELNSIDQVLNMNVLQKGKPRNKTKSLCKRPSTNIGDGLSFDEKIMVLETVLEKSTELSNGKNKKDDAAEDGAKYICDICNESYSRVNQYYGHLKTHAGEINYLCERCPGMVFHSRSLLNRHERQAHVIYRPFSCVSCSATFEKASQLDYHERRDHRGEKSHRCHFCTKAFFKRSDLKMHLNIHLGIHKCMCEVCGKKFNHVSNLNRHMRLHSGVKPYPCSECGRRFAQTTGLQLHKSTHISGKSVKCTSCSKMFKSEILMKKHCNFAHPGEIPKEVVQRKFDARKFYCNICGEMFPSSQDIRTHEKTHSKAQDLQCRSCGQSCDTVGAFKKHSCLSVEERNRQKCFLEGEFGKIKLESCETGDRGLPVILKPFLMKKNSYTLESTEDDESKSPEEKQTNFENLPCLGGEINQLQEFIVQSVETHLDEEEDIGDSQSVEIKTEFVDDSERSRNSPSPSFFDKVIEFKEEVDARTKCVVPPLKVVKETKRHECFCCEKVFTKLSNYRQHLGTHFSDKKSYNCSDCNRMFAWKSTLTRHILSSHNKGPAMKYSCILCPKHYLTPYQLQDHVKRDHFKERPHTCEICSKKFYKKYDLKVHLRVHTNERPYMCEWCGKSFYHISHIIRHERIHCNEKPYSCTDCGKKFRQSSALRTHQKTTKCAKRRRKAEEERAALDSFKLIPDTESLEAILNLERIQTV